MEVSENSQFVLPPWITEAVSCDHPENEQNSDFLPYFTDVYLTKIVHIKAMALHSSTLAWKIPWMEEPGRLQSMGSLRIRHD